MPIDIKNLEQVALTKELNIFHSLYNGKKEKHKNKY